MNSKILLQNIITKKKELERLANSLDETDNPILVIIKLKK